MQTHAPQPDEYDPYYGQYISLVQIDDILNALEQQPRETVALVSGLTEEQGNDRYAPGKWSVKQVLGHLADTERILAYRALRIARNDKKPMQGFEQDDYVREGPFERCQLSDLVEEFQAVRWATLLLFKHLDAEAWMRRGVANDKEVSARAIAYIIAGHEMHHRGVLKEKYLKR